jgi:hypothetical protein
VPASPEDPLALPTLGAADLAELRERGISAEEAGRQLALLRRPPAWVRLDRPCTPGDGIETVAPREVPDLLARHEAAAGAGRLTKFVPASGAATRMFQELLAVVDAERGGDPALALELLSEIRRFPFRESLRDALARTGQDLDELAAGGAFLEVLGALLGPDGLGLAALPKGLLPFHAYREGSRTALEEHLVEAAATVRGADGTCRLHLTVSPEHLDRFRDLLRTAGPAHERRLGARFDVSFSLQKPSTDTLAVGPDGTPLRDRDGRLLLRPSGHGALVENLNGLGADVVLIKNIDNVQPDHLRGATVEWKRILVGRLVEIEETVRALVRALEAGADPAVLREAGSFARSRLRRELPAGVPAEATRRELLLALSRPLRVCGVVRNAGEPGGGPFWTRDAGGGASLQIVESAEVDRASPAQRAIFEASTHFNPVDLVCGVRDARGRPFELRAFVNPDAVIVARKFQAGRELHALERPGLWNGAMARWNTVFVEVPPATFTPVKTVFDLLRPEHQPA